MWELRGRALRESPHAFGTHPDEHPPVEAYVELQERRWRDDHQCVVGAWWGGELVAMAAVVRERRLKLRHRASLYGMYVAPGARRGGVGRALLRAAAREARRMGAERLELTVTTVNAPALALYRGAGFRTWGVQPCALKSDGSCLDEAWMVLPLDEPPGDGD